MSIGVVRIATDEEHNLIYGASADLIETFQKANLGPDMALNILITAVAHVLVMQAKGKFLEDVIELTIDGLKKQIAALQKNIEGDNGRCMN